MEAENEPKGDKIAQLMFVERLFGLASLTELSKKECSKDEYIELASHIHSLPYLGYSRLHKMIIQKIGVDKRSMVIYERIIDKLIFVACFNCVKICLNAIIHYIGTLPVKNRVLMIKKFRNSCGEEIKNSPFALNDFKYDITEQMRLIKKYKKKSSMKKL